jgi:hypothetical protein
MDLKQKLIDMARAASGDPEITVAGDFQPKGLTWKRAVGAGAGSFIGGEVGGDIGQVIGSDAGFIAGTYSGTSGQLPAHFVVAASPTKLYLFVTNNGKGILLAKSLLLLDTLSRDHLTVTLKQRATTRTAIITDESTGHEYGIEGRRYIFHHMNDVLDALGSQEDDGDVPPGDESAIDLAAAESVTA